MRFQIRKHFRNTNIQQERGFIISGVDDILQALEDSTLLLNSILNLSVFYPVCDGREGDVPPGVVPVGSKNFWTRTRPGPGRINFFGPGPGRTR
jgi:hypothetical protein